MSQDEELSREALDLLAQVRAERAPRAADRERLFARLGVGVGVAASGVFAARSASSAGTSAGAAQGAGSAAVVTAKWWLIGGVLAVASAAGIGAYAGLLSQGAASDRPVARSARTTAALAPAVPSARPSAAPAPRPSAVPELALTPPTTTPSARRAAPAPTAAEDTAAQEVVLLHQARAALRSDSARALALAARHQQRFPRSQLSAEREIVTILALCDLGKQAQAQRRAAALASRSPALAALEGSCAERR